jgi:glycosyltransferase involved in cell wall biosynthesis
MRVLVVANLWPSPGRPEIGSFVKDQVDELIRLGVSVDVVAATPTGSRLSRLRYLRLGLGAMRASWRGSYDVVACHIAFPTGLLGVFARRPAGARLVLHAHGSDVMALPHRSAVHLRAAKAIFRSADCVVANSPFIRAAVVSLGVPAERVTVVSPGVAPAFYLASETTDRSGVLYVGRVTFEKGLETLIRAVGELGTGATELTIAGRGPAEQPLGELARSLGVAVRWTGPLPREEIAALMRRAAVVAVPSTMPEGLGLTALEGLATGAIVVATTSGALADSIVDGRTGFSARPGDVASTAGAIRRALASYESPAVHQAILREGYAVAEQHHAGRAAARLFEAYEQTMQRK